MSKVPKVRPFNAHFNELSKNMARQSLALMFEWASVVTHEEHVDISCGENSLWEPKDYLVHAGHMTKTSPTDSN